VQYDDVIVGAGSAGAVLAARLSENPARKVALLEAGPDYAGVELTPEDLRNALRMSLRAHDWGYAAEAAPGRMIPYPRGRVTGGSSAVNATIALRGVPADYDQWAALGNDGWGWEDVLPYFRRLEDDPEGGDDVHGRGGPVSIRRWGRDDWIPTQRAFFDVCRRLGFPEVKDHNHPDATGVGPFPQNRRERLRVSTAVAYLTTARERSNLDVQSHRLVDRVLLEGDRAVGVEVAEGTARRIVRGRRITLAAGAIGSPAILLRSGIGSESALAEVGVARVLDLPGVGAGLSDHAVSRLLLVPRPGSSDLRMPLAQVVLRYTAPGSDEVNDMQLVMFSHVDVAGIGGETAVANIGVPVVIGMPAALERPLSRGRVTLTSAEPTVPPRIMLNFADDPEDLRRLVEGVRLAWRVAHEPEIAAHVERVALLGEDALESDEALAAYVRATVTTQFHPCGTARMGPAHDAMAVVDSRCRLRGVENLRVVDASIMPTIPRANINLTTIMIGERVADWMREDA
jgi:choline dehydrogenase